MGGWTYAFTGRSDENIQPSKPSFQQKLKVAVPALPPHTQRHLKRMVAAQDATRNFATFT